MLKSTDGYTTRSVFSMFQVRITTIGLLVNRNAYEYVADRRGYLIDLKNQIASDEP